MAFESSQSGAAEAAARRAAMNAAFAAAAQEARDRHVRRGALLALVEGEPYVARSLARDPSDVPDQRVAVVMRVDATFATAPRARR
ncbi:MAG: hypothetical protein NVSMB21_21160 [Vulcanimicrobiaceae bacterium]